MSSTNEILYPIRMTHKGHHAFRMKSRDTMELDGIIYPSGRHPGDKDSITCFTCGGTLNLMGVIAGLWKMQ